MHRRTARTNESMPPPDQRTGRRRQAQPGGSTVWTWSQDEPRQGPFPDSDDADRSKWWGAEVQCELQASTQESEERRDSEHSGDTTAVAVDDPDDAQDAKRHAGHGTDER